MARSRRWTTGYRQAQITLYFQVWKDVVRALFAILNDKSDFVHQFVELKDVPVVRAAGLYTEAWLTVPDKLGRECVADSDRFVRENRLALTVVLSRLARRSGVGAEQLRNLARSLNPAAVRVLRDTQPLVWSDTSDQARLLAFDDAEEEANFNQAAAETGLGRWIAANRQTWLGDLYPGASSVAQHERMHAVVDAYFDDVHRIESLGRRAPLSLLVHFPTFALVQDPVESDLAAFDRACQAADLRWHRRFVSELGGRTEFESHVVAIERLLEKKESQALPAYRAEPHEFTGYDLIAANAVANDVAGAIRWINDGGAQGQSAEIAVRVLASLPDVAAATDELGNHPAGLQGRVVMVCVAALLATGPDEDEPGQRPGDDARRGSRGHQ